MRAYFLLLFTFYITVTNAQDPEDIPPPTWNHEIRVSKAELELNDVMETALEVPVFGTREKDVERIIRDQLEDQSADVDRSGNIYHFSGLQLPVLGTGNFDAYLEADRKGDIVRLTVALFQDGENIAGDTEAFSRQQEFMYNWAVTLNKRVVELRLTEEREELASLRDEMNDLVEEETDLRDDAIDHAEDLDDANRDMEKAIAQLDREREQLTSLMEEYPSPGEKELKKLKKQRRKVEKAEKKISDALDDQKKYTKRSQDLHSDDLPDNQEDQRDLAGRLSVQEKIVQALERQLERVR